MATNNDTLIQGAKAQANRLQSEIEESYQKNKLLGNKIEHLDHAIKYAQAAANSASDLEGFLARTGPGEWWGKNWDNFEKKVHGWPAHEQAANLTKNCYKYKGDIEKKRWELQLKIDYLAEFIKTAQNSLNDIKNQIAQLTKQMQEQH